MAAVSLRTQPAAAAPAGQACPNAQQHRSQNSRARQLQSQQQRATLPASLARLMGCAVGPSSNRQQQAKQLHASVPVANWRPGSIKQRITEGLKGMADVPPGKQPASSMPHGELSHKVGGPAEEGHLRWQQRRPGDPAASHLDLQRSRQLPADSCAAPAAAAAGKLHAAANAACTRRPSAVQGGAHQQHLQPENAMQQPQQQPPDSTWRKSKRAKTAAGPPRTPLGTKRNGASNGSVDFLDEIMPTTGCKRPAAMPAQRPEVPTLRLEAATTEGTGAVTSRQQNLSTETLAAEQKQHTGPAAKPEEQQPSQPHAAGAGDAEGNAAAAPAVRRPLQATPWRRRKSSLDVPGVVVPLLPPLPSPPLPPAPSPPLQHNPRSDAETQPAEADDDAFVQQQASTEHPHAAVAANSTARGSLLDADTVPATQPAVEAIQHSTGPEQQHAADGQGMDDMMDVAPPPDRCAAAAQSAEMNGMQQPRAGGSTPLHAAQHSVLPPGTTRVCMSCYT